MSVEVIWDNEPENILRVISQGAWTWDEYHKALARIIELTQGKDQRVDIITVSLPGTKHPSGSPMPHYRRAATILPRNVRMNAIVNQGRVGRMLVNIFLKLYGSSMNMKIFLAASLEDAREAIHHDRAEAKR